MAPALVHRQSRRWIKYVVLSIGRNLDVPGGARVGDTNRKLPDTSWRAIRFRRARNGDVQAPRFDWDLGRVVIPLGRKGSLIRVRRGPRLYRELARPGTGQAVAFEVTLSSGFGDRKLALPA